jgi:hypothetical protein
MNEYIKVNPVGGSGGGGTPAVVAAKDPCRVVTPSELVVVASGVGVGKTLSTAASVPPTVVYIEATSVGVAGNSITLSVSGFTMSVSGPTLTGGSPTTKASGFVYGAASASPGEYVEVGGIYAYKDSEWFDIPSLRSFIDSYGNVITQSNQPAPGFISVDGVNCILNDRILVTKQVTSGNIDNGIYKVTTAGTDGKAYVDTYMSPNLWFAGGGAGPGASVTFYGMPTDGTKTFLWVAALPTGLEFTDLPSFISIFNATMTDVEAYPTPAYETTFVSFRVLLPGPTMNSSYHVAPYFVGWSSVDCWFTGGVTPVVGVMTRATDFDENSEIQRLGDSIVIYDGLTLKNSSWLVSSANSIDVNPILFSSSSGAGAIGTDNSSVAGDTRFLVYDVDNGTLERVTVGIADSGGVGYKVLRIPN